MLQLPKLAQKMGQRVLQNGLIERYFRERMLERKDVLAESNPWITSVQTLGHESRVSFPDPPFLGDLPSGIASAPASVSTPPWSVCVCERAQLVGPEGLTILPDGSFLAENSLGWSLRIAVSSVKAIGNRTLPRYSNSVTCSYDCAVSLAGPWTENYYHWLVDYLLRLAPLNAATETVDTLPTVLLPPDNSRWMREALELAGYPRSKMETLDGKRTEVERLIVPFLPRETTATAPNLDYLGYSNSPTALNWLTTKMRESVGRQKTVAEVNRRYFISRQGARDRIIANMNEVNKVLDRFGIEVLRPQRLSVSEQISTFERAELLVGVHGAGLANQLWGDDLTLIELFGDHTHPAYFALARLIENEYVCVTFDQTAHGIDINPDCLERALELAGFSPR